MRLEVVAELMEDVCEKILINHFKRSKYIRKY